MPSSRQGLFPVFYLLMLSGLGGAFASAGDSPEPRWEAPPTAIQRQMAADPAATPVKDSANHLSYRGGTCFGQPVQSWRFTVASPQHPAQLAIRFAPAAQDFHHLFIEQHGSADEFADVTRRDSLWDLGPSTVFPGQTGHALLTLFSSRRDRHLELIFFNSPSPTGSVHSELRYTLQRDPHATPAQLDAYRRITDAMDRAVRFYERYTVGIVKTDTVFLDPTEATAEGNINGNIQFGPTDISLRTALHEMSHTVGIGTTPEYHRLVINERFIGKHALAQLRAITGDDHAVLHADTWHFWPYGLNNPGEDHSIWDYVYHCQMVSAIWQDCQEVH